MIYTSLSVGVASIKIDNFILILFRISNLSLSFFMGQYVLKDLGFVQNSTDLENKAKLLSFLEHRK
jgi:hypothetical protein